VKRIKIPPHLPNLRGGVRIAGLACSIALAIAFGLGRAAAKNPLDAATARPSELARLVLDSGIEGGFIVHLGCGDGNFSIALRSGDTFVVQGLDRDAAGLAVGDSPGDSDPGGSQSCLMAL